MTDLAERLRLVVIHDVSMRERHNALGRDVAKGETLYLFTGATYGCIDDEYGVAISENPGEGPFYEFPRYALRDINGKQMWW